MNAYAYINACDAIGPAIHKNGLFYGREADFTRSVHEFECFYGRKGDFTLVVHESERFYGREADFTRAVHEFERFYGRPIVSGQSGAGQPPSEVPPRHIALLLSPKTAEGAGKPPSEAATRHIALLHPARRRREEVTGSQAVRRKPQTGQEKTKTQEFYRISAEATTFATLARRAATLPLSAGWTRWVRSITAQRASRSMTIEVPV